jgi:hypothetical protein
MAARQSSARSVEPVIPVGDVFGPAGHFGAPRRRINGDGNGDGNGNGNGEPPEPVYNPNLQVLGVERTQAAQYFNFNSQGTALGADDAMPMIEQKTTIFRVYADVRQVSAEFPVPTQVTGGMSIYRINWPPPPDIENLTPINGLIAAGPASNIQRGRTDDTLNFRLPAWLSKPGTKGTMGVAVGIWDPDHPGDPTYSSLGFSMPSFGFWPGKQLPLHVVRIVYTGPDSTGRPMTIGPPPEFQMISTFTNSFITKTYPITGIKYNGSTVAEFGGDLATGGPTGCGDAWNSLLAMLRDMKTASNSGDLYVGLLPTGTPIGSILGCGGGGVAAGYVTDSTTVVGQRAQVTMAQELAHALGRQHAPCAVTAPNPDSSYPAYTTGPPGCIGEVGFNTTSGAAVPATTTFDYMSYCSPNWTSPYSYQNLLWLSLLLPS